MEPLSSQLDSTDRNSTYVRSSALYRTRSSVSFALVAALLVLTACGDIFGAPPVGPEGPGFGGLEDGVTRLVNDHRETLGCRRLVWNPDVARVALGHSRDMLERDFFGHYDPDGNGLKQRLESARVSYLDAAENIAQGFRYDDAALKVFEGWISSPQHRRIIENCTFVIHGIGVADYRWTHVFMR